MTCFFVRVVSRSVPFAALCAAFAAATPVHAQFLVRTAHNAGTISTITDAENAFTNPAATVSGFSSATTLNYLPNGNPFPNGRTGTDDFALEAFSSLVFNNAGSYIFRVNSDDGFRLRTGVNANGTGGTTYTEVTGARAPANTDGAALVQGAGSASNIRLTYFERGGGEQLVFSYSRDNGTTFQTVGSTSDITVRPNVGPGAAAPEPGTLALLGSGLLTGLGFVKVRRRCN